MAELKIGDIVVGKCNCYEVVARDCEYAKMSIDELVELLERVDREQRFQILTLLPTLRIVRDMIRQLLPDHSEEINVFIGSCRAPNEATIVIEVPHFEHFATEDIISLARIMAELELLLGPTYVQMIMNNCEYLAIVTFGEKDFVLNDVVNILRELKMSKR